MNHNAIDILSSHVHVDVNGKHMVKQEMKNLLFLFNSVI